MRPFFLKRISILFLICYALYLLGNNFYHLTDPDEVFYSMTAKEMAAKNEWLTPLIFGQPQFEKPPLTYWLLEFSFKNWGITPFNARLFPSIFAALGIMAIYFLGLMGFKDERKAFLSALVLSSGAFYVGMGKTVFTDMIFTVFILCSFVMFILAYTNQKRQGIGFVGFYVFCALATLTKSPLGFVIPHIAIIFFILYQRQINFLRNWWILVGFVIYLIIALPWYLYIYDHYGQAFIQEYFYNDHWRRFLEAEHHTNDRWYFYPLTMIAGLFPWSLFLVAAGVDLFKRLKNSVSLMDYLALSWIIAVLLVFQMAHSKLASYILPLFPALALMTGNFLGNSLSQIYDRKRIQNLLCASFIILGVLGIAVMAAYKLYHHYIPSQLPAYFLSGSLIAISGVGITLAFKERFQISLYVLALTLIPLFATAFLVRADVEGYASSYEACQYIPQRSLGAMTVFVSKANARGVRFFTEQDIAVIDFSGKQFFSPHPVPILDTKEKILDVLEHQRVTYALVRKAVYQYLIKDFSGKFHIVLLRTIGNDDVVRIVPSTTSLKPR